MNTRLMTPTRLVLALVACLVGPTSASLAHDAAAGRRAVGHQRDAGQNH